MMLHFTTWQGRVGFTASKLNQFFFSTEHNSQKNGVIKYEIILLNRTTNPKFHASLKTNQFYIPIIVVQNKDLGTLLKFLLLLNILN